MNSYKNQYRFIDDVCYIDCFNTKGVLTGSIIIDKDDYDIVKDYQWHIENSRKNLQYGQSFTKGTLPTKTIRIHRLLMPNSLQIDHINHNGLDNRKCNLRICNNQENNCNKNFLRNPKSGYTGIRYNEKADSYYVRITVHKKEISLGHYKSLEEALEARRQGEMTYFGKFRYLDNQYVKKENVTT